MARKTQREKKLMQLAGEHAVCAQLAMRGYYAAHMLQGWKGIDIMAELPGSFELIGVQVKTTSAGRGAYINKEGPTPYPVVCVRVHELEMEYFVVPAGKAAVMRDEYHAANKRKNPNLKDTGPRFMPWDMLEPYRDQWQNITRKDIHG